MILSIFDKESNGMKRICGLFLGFIFCFCLACSSVERQDPANQVSNETIQKTEDSDSSKPTQNDLKGYLLP